MKKLFLIILLLFCTAALYAGGPTKSCLQTAVASFWEEFGSSAIYSEKAVGIGTTTPDVTKALHVVGDIKVDGYIYGQNDFMIYAGGNPKMGISGSSFSYMYGVWQIYQAQPGLKDGFNMYGDSDTEVTNPAANTMAFFNGGVETMRTTEDSAVVVGKTTSDGVSKFQVVGNTTESDGSFTWKYLADSNGSLAVDGTHSLSGITMGSADAGQVTVTNRTNSASAMFFVESGSSTFVAGQSTYFSDAKDTASKVNVYIESNAIVIQNKTASAISVKMKYTGFDE